MLRYGGKAGFRWLGHDVSNPGSPPRASVGLFVWPALTMNCVPFPKLCERLSSPILKPANRNREVK